MEGGLLGKIVRIKQINTEVDVVYASVYMGMCDAYGGSSIYMYMYFYF